MTIWLPDLSTGSGPLYLRLAERIESDIDSGVLASGSKLPPQRDLAYDIGVTIGTVGRAYALLRERGLVSGEVGRGTYVLAGSKEATLFHLKQQDVQPDLIDLSTNVPAIDPDNHDIERTLQSLLNSGQARCLEHYLSAEALLLARVQGAAWLANRGLQLTASQVLLCGGAQQGLFSLLLSLCQAGEPVLVEALTAPGIKAACRQLRLPLHGIAQDLDGIIPQDLDRVARATGARVVVLTPCLQNPTASCMSRERQQAVADVVHRHGLLVIEDDVYGALVDQPALWPRLGQQGILVSSLSKTVGAGLRLGWIVADPQWLAKVDPHAQATHWQVSPLNLQIACRWIADGTAARRLAWQREEVAWRWRLARRILGSDRLYGQHPSPHIWLHCTQPAQALVQRCRANAVEVVPADVFAVKQSDLPAVRISLSAASSRAELKQALERVAQALETQ